MRAVLVLAVALCDFHGEQALAAPPKKQPAIVLGATIQVQSRSRLSGDQRFIVAIHNQDKHACDLSELSTGRLIKTFHGFDVGRFSPDGNRLQLFDAQTREPKLFESATGNSVPMGQVGPAQDVWFSRDNKHLILSPGTGLENLELVSIATGKPLITVAGIDWKAWKTSPNGRLLAVVKDRGKVTLWDTSTARIRTTLQIDYVDELNLEFSRNGSTLLSRGDQRA